MLCCLCASLSKETGLTVVAVCIVYDVCIVNKVLGIYTLDLLYLILSHALCDSSIPTCRPVIQLTMIIYCDHVFMFNGRPGCIYYIIYSRTLLVCTLGPI